VRRLILLRHAKSSWDSPALADSERTLNDRGRRDAPRMAQRLLRSGARPDHVLCSTARRTRDTVAEFLRAWDIPEECVSYRDDLYLATVSAAQGIIASAPDAARTLLLVGHNPTCTELANRHGDLRIDNVPTCAYVSIDLDIEHWSAIGQARGHTAEFACPRQADG
jgi:phosphohistidine phosphatase